MRSRAHRVFRDEGRIAFVFLLPWFAGLIVFQLGPILGSLALSFTDYTFTKPVHWVGTQNYENIFLNDSDFRDSLVLTLKYLGLWVPLFLVLGLALSLLLNLRLPGMYLFRTILFIPAVLSGVVVAILWSSLLNPDFGAVNSILRSMGVNNPPLWFGSPDWAVPSLTLIGLWGVGGSAIIYLAGLQNIPSELYEAAVVDGAGPLRRFRHITLPLLTPTLLFVLLTSLIAAFQVFDVAYILAFQGGFLYGTPDFYRVYLLNFWIQAFQNGRIGYAAGLAWLLILFAGCVILLIFKTSSRWVYQEHDPGREK